MSNSSFTTGFCIETSFISFLQSTTSFNCLYPSLRKATSNVLNEMKVWALKLISCTFAALLALSECRAGYQYIGSHGFSSHHQKFSKYQFPEDDTRAAGETCTPYIGRCESGLTCHPDAVTEHTWKCKKALPLGSFCINDTKEFCDGTNAVCRESKCTIVSPIGAQCGKANTLCGEGLTCTSFIPRLSDKICAKVSPRTAQCGRSKFEFCARGLQCVAAQNVCFRPPPQPFSNFHALNQRMTHKELKFDSQCGPNSTQHRTYSGYCNNKGHPEWGSADTVFHSLLKDVPLRENLPNARVISNIICADQGDLKNKRGLTTLFTFFGQFIDQYVLHDSYFLSLLTLKPALSLLSTLPKKLTTSRLLMTLNLEMVLFHFSVPRNGTANLSILCPRTLMVQWCTAEPSISMQIYEPNQAGNSCSWMTTIYL